VNTLAEMAFIYLIFGSRLAMNFPDFVFTRTHLLVVEFKSEKRFLTFIGALLQWEYFMSQ
jgi:hypothetical protein